MSPFTHTEEMIINHGNVEHVGDDATDRDILENIELAKASLMEVNKLTDVKISKEELEMKLVEEQWLAEVLNEKTKELSELTQRLDCLKSDYGQRRKQLQLSHQIAVDVYNDCKHFMSNVSREIRQKQSVGFDIECKCNDGLITAKICKDDKWIELVVNEKLGFNLLNMYPKPHRFDEIKILFDSTMNIHGLFSIYEWHQ